MLIFGFYYRLAYRRLSIPHQRIAISLQLVSRIGVFLKGLRLIWSEMQGDLFICIH